MKRQISENALQEAIRHLPRSQLPERDLWPGIAQAINTQPDTHWPRYAALAASVLLVLCASLYYGRLELVAEQPGQVSELISALQTEHENSVQALLVEYQGQEPLYAGWQEQMQQLEQAEQVIYQALREEPDNIELLKILRQVQQKQLKLIDSTFDHRLSSI